MWRIAAVTVVLAQTVGGLAAAQGVPTPNSGDVVRVSNAGQQTVYEVVEWMAPELVVKDRKTHSVLPIPVTSIDRIDVRSGYEPRTRSLARGMGIGFVIGAALGAVLGYADGDDPPEEWLFNFTAEEKAVLFGVTTGAASAVIGGVIGAASPRTRWQTVAPPARVEVIPPSRDGAGVRLTLGV